MQTEKLKRGLEYTVQRCNILYPTGHSDFPHVHCDVAGEHFLHCALCILAAASGQQHLRASATPSTDPAQQRSGEKASACSPVADGTASAAGGYDQDCQQRKQGLAGAAASCRLDGSGLIKLKIGASRLSAQHVAVDDGEVGAHMQDEHNLQVKTQQYFRDCCPVVNYRHCVYINHPALSECVLALMRPHSALHRRLRGHLLLPGQ